MWLLRQCCEEFVSLGLCDSYSRIDFGLKVTVGIDDGSKILVRVCEV